MVADRELGNASAHRLHLARAVGHDDTSVLGREAAGNHPVVVEVQRACAHPNADLARPRRARIGQVDKLEPVQARGKAQADRLHR
jgi:hypothetical protein